MDKKKKNMQSKTAGSKKNTIATLGRIDNPYVRNIIANEMVEMRSDGSAVRPVLPILYNI